MALRVLAQAQGEFTAGQVCRIASTATPRGFRNVLERLTVQGIVVAHPTSAGTLYSLNRTHLAADAVLALASLRQRFIDLAGERFSQLPVRPVFAALFGSAARSDMRPDSDLDVFVVRPTNVDVDDTAWREPLDALLDDFTAWTGNDARVLEFTQAQLAAGDEPVLEDIAREGIPLHGSLEWLRRAMRTAG